MVVDSAVTCNTSRLGWVQFQLLPTVTVNCVKAESQDEEAGNGRFKKTKSDFNLKLKSRMLAEPI